jgi:hypothetical protein
MTYPGQRLGPAVVARECERPTDIIDRSRRSRRNTVVSMQSSLVCIHSFGPGLSLLRRIGLCNYSGHPEAIFQYLSTLRAVMCCA